MIKAFTSTIAVITSFFDDHLTANPNEEVVDPDVGTGDVDKPGEGTEGEDDTALYAEAALAARDQEIERICALSNTQRDKYVAVAAGYNKITGQVTVGAKIEEVGIRTYCVEDMVADQLIALGANLEDIVMTPAIRPRTMEIVPVCKFCQLKYTRDNFLPGTPFE